MTCSRIEIYRGGAIHRYRHIFDSDTAAPCVRDRHRICATLGNRIRVPLQTLGVGVAPLKFVAVGCTWFGCGGQHGALVFANGLRTRHRDGRDVYIRIGAV